MSNRVTEAEKIVSTQAPTGERSEPDLLAVGPQGDGFWNQFLWLFLYAVAMAWVEAAVVLYLRTIVGQMDPYRPQPMPGPPILEKAELIREAATLVMLVSVGWLAGRSWRSRLACAVVAFGVWDIFYYVFLKVLTGWPNSCLDWDILFLLPLPWWGPVLAPVLIALLMIGGGMLVARFDSRLHPFWPSRRSLVLNLCGGLLALYVFMTDAIHALGQGSQALRNLLPVWFNWPLFLAALGLMALPVLELAWRAWRQRALGGRGILGSESRCRRPITTTATTTKPSL